MTRQELGDRLGVKPPTIYKWERGLGLPKWRRPSEWLTFSGFLWTISWAGTAPNP